MKKLIGSYLKVYFKNNLADKMLEGLLLEVEDGSIYLQVQIGGVMEVLIIPQPNVLYYSTDKIPPAKSLLVNSVQEENPIPTLKVLVNNELAAQIPIKHLDLNQWSPEIMAAVLADEQVHKMLSHKKIMSVEYMPFEMKISVKNLELSEPIRSNKNNDDFSMSYGGAAVNNYLDPSQMVSRLNGIVKTKEK